ncbi:MAG: hypothetical protein IT464_09840 [Planctomycetes bacterium]|nr:hypothetical protein [Planctomycetota bacterium]
MPDRRRAKYAVLVALLCLFVLVGLLLIWQWPEPSTQVTYNKPAVAPVARPAKPQPIAANSEPDETPAEPIDPVEAPVPAVPQPKKVVIAFRTHDDQPVAGIGFEYAFETVEQFVRRPKNAGEQDVSWTTGTVGGGGTAQVRSTLGPDELEYLSIRPLALLWKLRTNPLDARRGQLPGSVLVEVKADGQHVVVRLERTNRVAVEVIYGDGAPFAGRIRLLFVSGEGARFKDHGLVWLTLEEGETGYVDIPDQTTRVSMFTAGLRMGWQQPATFLFQIDAHARTLKAIVPVATKLMYGVRVDLSRLPSSADWKLEFRRNGLTGIGPSGVLKWGSAYTNFALGFDGDFEIRIEGALGVWDSGAFRVGPDEVREFVAEVTLPVTIRLRAVDPYGTPIGRSSATVRGHLLPSWEMYRLRERSARRAKERAKERAASGKEPIKEGPSKAKLPPPTGQNGALAYAEPNGEITLSGVASSLRMLYVEGDGYEQTEVPFNAKPGDQLDLGDVVLKPAAGSITFKFVNAEPGAEFLYTVGKERSGPGGERGTTSGSAVHTVTGLSINRGVYWVVVFTKGTTETVEEGTLVRSGAKLVDQHVTLTETEAGFVLEIDVRNPPYKRPPTPPSASVPDED